MLFHYSVIQWQGHNMEAMNLAVVLPWFDHPNHYAYTKDTGRFERFTGVQWAAVEPAVKELAEATREELERAAGRPYSNIRPTPWKPLVWEDMSRLDPDVILGMLQRTYLPGTA